MILDIYILLLVIAAFFICLGFYLKGNADIFKFVGFAFLFLLGIIIMPGMPTALEYESGATITEAGGTTTLVKEYTEYSSFTYGFYIAITGGLGFIVSLFLRKRTEFGNEE